MRKVYGLLAVQLTITTIIGTVQLRWCQFFLLFIQGAVLLFTPGVKEAVQGNSWMLFPAFLLSMGLLVALHVKRKETPINLILLAAFTVVEVVSSSSQISLLLTLKFYPGVYRGCFGDLLWPGCSCSGVKSDLMQETTLGNVLNIWLTNRLAGVLPNCCRGCWPDCLHIPGSYYYYCITIQQHIFLLRPSGTFPISAPHCTPASLSSSLADSWISSLEGVLHFVYLFNSTSTIIKIKMALTQRVDRDSNGSGGSSSLFPLYHLRHPGEDGLK